MNNECQLLLFINIYFLSPTILCVSFPVYARKFKLKILVALLPEFINSMHQHDSPESFYQEVVAERINQGVIIIAVCRSDNDCLHFGLIIHIHLQLSLLFVIFCQSALSISSLLMFLLTVSLNLNLGLPMFPWSNLGYIEVQCQIIHPCQIIDP